MRRYGQRAGARAAMAGLLLLPGGIPSGTLTDRGTITFVRRNDPHTQIASGVAFGSVTGTPPARTMQLNATSDF